MTVEHYIWYLPRVILEMFLELLRGFFKLLLLPHSSKPEQRLRKQVKAQREQIDKLQRQVMQLQGEKTDLERRPVVLRDSMADILRLSTEMLREVSPYALIQSADGWGISAEHCRTEDGIKESYVFSTEREALLYGLLLEAAGYRETSEKKEDEVKENEAA